MTTNENGVIVRYIIKKKGQSALPGKEKDMSTMILSLNKIVERQYDAMPVLSEQGFDCVYSYKDRISKDTEENVI